MLSSVYTNQPQMFAKVVVAGRPKSGFFLLCLRPIIIIGDTGTTEGRNPRSTVFFK